MVIINLIRSSLASTQFMLTKIKSQKRYVLIAKKNMLKLMLTSFLKPHACSMGFSKRTPQVLLWHNLHIAIFHQISFAKLICICLPSCKSINKFKNLRGNWSTFSKDNVRLTKRSGNPCSRVIFLWNMRHITVLPWV